MRLAGLIGAALLIGGAAAAPAQQADTTSSRDELHLRGCVIRGAESNVFVLTKAVTVGVAKTTDAMPPRASSTTAADARVQSYRLAGSDVATFVDHLVEVVGTVEPKRPKDESSSLTAPTASQDVVRVKTIQSLANSCS